MKPKTPINVLRATRRNSRFQRDPIHTTMARHIRKTYDNDDLVQHHPGVYEIVRELGAGEFGTATQIRHLPSNKDLVVKRYFPSNSHAAYGLVPDADAEQHASTVFRLLGLQAPYSLGVGPDKNGARSSISSLIPGERWPTPGLGGTLDDWETRQWLGKKIRSDPFLAGQVLTTPQADHYTGRFDATDGRNTLLVYPQEENGRHRVGNVDFDLTFGDHGLEYVPVFDEDMVRNAVQGIGGKKAAGELFIANNNKIKTIIDSGHFPPYYNDYLLDQTINFPDSELVKFIQTLPNSQYVYPGSTA